MTEDLQAPTPDNPAVAICLNAYDQAHKAALAQGKGQVFAKLGRLRSLPQRHAPAFR